MVWKQGHQLRGDRYTIERVLGRGRFAVTYLAFDRHGTRIVIKTLSDVIIAQLQGDLDAIARWQDKLWKEATKLAHCQHHHVVRCLGQPWRELDGDYKLVCVPLEYIAGIDLASLPQKRLSETAALRYIKQIGGALTCIHAKGLLHRDVKPENILVRHETGEAVLIDFNLARETDTPLSDRREISDGFASLELYIDSMTLNARSDIYSLAATLYFLVTGETPPSAEKRQSNLSEVRLIPPKEITPDLSDRVNDAILQGMSLEPDFRPKDMETWLKSLGLNEKRRVSIERVKEKLAIAAVIIGFLAALAGFLNDGIGFVDRMLSPKESPPETTEPKK